MHAASHPTRPCAAAPHQRPNLSQAYPVPGFGRRGEVKTADTVCHEILREITRAARQFEAAEFRVIAAPSIVERLSEDQSQSLAELEEHLGRPIRLQAETQYARDNFDVVPT